MIFDAADAEILAYTVAKKKPEQLRVHLFVNDIEPSATDSLRSFVEASGAGYSPILLRGGAWTVDDTSSPSSAEHPPVDFIFSGVLGDVFGYYMTREKSGALVSAQRFNDGPYSITVRGDKVRVTPRLVSLRQVPAINLRGN